MLTPGALLTVVLGLAAPAPAEWTAEWQERMRGELRHQVAPAVTREAVEPIVECIAKDFMAAFPGGPRELVARLGVDVKAVQAISADATRRCAERVGERIGFVRKCAADGAEPRMCTCLADGVERLYPSFAAFEKASDDEDAGLLAAPERRRLKGVILPCLPKEAMTAAFVEGCTTMGFAREVCACMGAELAKKGPILDDASKPYDLDPADRKKLEEIGAACLPRRKP